MSVLLAPGGVLAIQQSTSVSGSHVSNITINSCSFAAAPLLIWCCCGTLKRPCSCIPPTCKGHVRPTDSSTAACLAAARRNPCTLTQTHQRPVQPAGFFTAARPAACALYVPLPGVWCNTRTCSIDLAQLLLLLLTMPKCKRPEFKDLCGLLTFLPLPVLLLPPPWSDITPPPTSRTCAAC